MIVCGCDLIKEKFWLYGTLLTSRLLACEGVPVSLTPKAFETLVFLVRNQGRILTKDELLKQIWPDAFVEEVNLALNISTVRKALGENPHDCRFIATVPGRGYRFIAEVRKIADQNKEDRITNIFSVSANPKASSEADALEKPSRN